MQPATPPAPDKLATPPPLASEPAKSAAPAMAVSPAPDPVPQPMAVALEPKSEGMSLPTVEVEPETNGHNDHPEHVPEPLTEADAHPTQKSAKPQTPPPVPPAGPHAPVGIIVATVFGMLILCGLAVAIYMTSQT